jgi:glycosyltransferase involved in cell wall biosynthesis
MKICFVNTNIAWGGGEKWHLEQAELLYTSGFKISFICHPHSELFKKIQKKPYSIFTIKTGKTSFLNPLKRFKIKSFLIKSKPSSVILNLPQDVKLVAPIAKKLNISKVIYRRGMDHPIKRSFINKVIYINCLTDFIANSKAVSRSITKNFPELKDRIHIIYNSVSLMETPPPKKTTEKIILGNLGRLVKQKGQEDLIDLAILLKKQSFNFEIIIAGTGPLHDLLIDKVKSNNLEDCVKLLGHCDTGVFLKKIDFFIFPSRFEGLSNALLEAMLYRKVIFAYDISSNSEIINNGSDGFLFELKNIQAMSKKIIEIASNQVKLQEIQEGCLQKLKEKFDKSKTTQQLIELVS